MPAPASPPTSRMPNNRRQPAQERLKRLQTDLKNNRKQKHEKTGERRNRNSTSDISNDNSSSRSSSNSRNSRSLILDSVCTEKINRLTSSCINSNASQTSPVVATTTTTSATASSTATSALVGKPRRILGAHHKLKTHKETRHTISPVRRIIPTPLSTLSRKAIFEAIEPKTSNRLSGTLAGQKLPRHDAAAAAATTTTIYIDGPSTSAATLAQRLRKTPQKRVHETEAAAATTTTTIRTGAYPKLPCLDNSAGNLPRIPFQKRQQRTPQEHQQQTIHQKPLSATCSVRENAVPTASVVSQQPRKSGFIEKIKRFWKPTTTGPRCHGSTSEPKTTTSASTNTTINVQRIVSPLMRKIFRPGKAILINAWQKPKALSDAAKSSQPKSIKYTKNIASKRLKQLISTFDVNQGSREYNNNEASQQMPNNVDQSVDAPTSIPASGSASAFTAPTTTVVKTSKSRVAVTAPGAASPSNNIALEAKTSTSVNRSKVFTTQACLSYMRILTEIDFEPMDWEPENFEQTDYPNSDEYFTASPMLHTQDPLDFVDDVNDGPLTPLSSNDDEDDNAICDFSSGGTNADINELTELNEQQQPNEPVHPAASHDNLFVSDADVVLSSSSSSLSRRNSMASNVAVELNRSISNDEQLPDWKEDNLYFVLDTNVLINYLLFVEELTKTTLFDTAGGMLFIPYTVIRELDSLKSQSQRDGVRVNAVRAINYLNAKFDESNTIKAQSASAEQEHLVEVISADDSIINCCLQLKSVVPNMLLLTDDGNMRLKAKANDIPVTTKSDLIAEYPEQFASFCNN